MFGKTRAHREEPSHDPEEAATDDGSVNGAIPDEGDPEPANEVAVEAPEESIVVAEGEPEVQREEALDDPSQRLAEELEAANDRHLRLVAEFENYRKRTRREQAELSSVAQADFVRLLLPTLDDLARVAATPSETTTVEALEQGLDLILRNLLKELSEAGMTRIDALGARFDPEIHQAIMTADTDEPELDDIVSRVFVDGYEFAGRLVRPAQVEVLNYGSEGDGAA